MVNSTLISQPLALNGGLKAKTTPYPTGKRFDDSELQQLKEALDQNTLFYFKGNKVKEFTNKFAKMLGINYCSATSSGSASIHVALIALGITVGDEVIVSPLTDMGSVIGILYQNAIPVFADIDPYNYCTTAESIEKKITPRTKAIIAVHILGTPCDMPSIMRLSEKYNIPVIEDCAQAYGTKLNDKPIGTFGTLGCFSTNDFKHISTGDGGMITTSSETLHLKALAAADKNYERTGKGLGKTPEFLAPNYRMTELQGAVGIAQLDKLNSICERRHKLGSYLTTLLSNIEGIIPFQELKNGVTTYFNYGGRFDLKKFKVNRAKLIEALNAEGVPIGAYLPEPLYLYNLFKNRTIYPNSSYPLDGTGKQYKYEKGICPIAEEVIDTMFIFPLREFYTNKDIEETAEAFQKVTSAFLQ